VILSTQHFVWVCLAVTGIVAAIWIGVDVGRLRHALTGDRTSGFVRDRIFGSLIGIVVALVGVLGVALHLGGR